MIEPVDTATPLFQWLFGLGLLLLVIWLLDRAFPARPEDDVDELAARKRDQMRAEMRDC